MTDFAPERPHPLGLIDNPEWQISLTRRAELYLAERERRINPEREPTGTGVAAAIIGILCVAIAAVSFLTGSLLS